LWLCHCKRGKQTARRNRSHDRFHMSLHTSTRRLRPGTITQGT
jgi:hypothetical protein